MDITQLILDDHHEQRRRFSIIEQIAPADTDVLAAVWARLATFLEVHAAADAAEAETLDAIHDHNDIRDAVAAVAGHRVGSSGWFAAVAAANEANSDHMGEEEREGLTDFRRRASLQLRHDLAVAFADYEARYYAGVTPVDRDPETYVHDEERGIPRPESSEGPAGAGVLTPDGSLNIGSLRNTP